jgi:hypothetical protein
MNNNTLLRVFHGLLKQAGLLANKEDILAGFGVDSAKDLTREQILSANNALREIVEKKDQAPLEVRKARSRILTLCTDLGVWDGKNWKPLNDYLLNKKIAGKLLPDMSLTELNALNRKLSGMLRKVIAEREKNNKLAKLN